MTEPALGNGVVTQIAIAVHDIEKAVETYSRVFGMKDARLTEDVDVCEVGAHVNRDDDDDAEDDAARQVSPWIPNFAGHEADELPPVIRKERRDHRQPDARQQACCDVFGGERPEVGGSSGQREHGRQNECRQAGDLEKREQVLNAGTLADAARVDEREAEQHGDTERLLRNQR